VYFAAGVPDDARADPNSASHKLLLTFKRYVYDKSCARLQ
jgi:hypothetical protein